MRIANDDVSKFLTRMAPYVAQDGARNLNRISRELSIPYQTLRFRMMRLKDQGIGINPVVNAESLGLERMRVAFNLSKDIVDPVSFFGGLHQTAGLHYYSRSMVTQEFHCEFMIAPPFRAELSRLLKALEEMEILKNITVRGLEWKEILMMRTEFYDYEHEEWDVDYTRLTSNPSIKIPSPHPSDDYDHTDLLIIKSLQLDPWVKVVDLAKQFKMTEGDISYHMNRHVFGRKQIPGFRFLWIGTPEAWSKHSVLGVTTLFRELTEEACRRAIAVVTSCPFTWNHMRAEDGTYISELLIPTAHLPETLQYLSDNFRKMDLKPELLYPDWSCSSSYTVPYLAHISKKGWQLNAEESLAYVMQMIKASPKS